MADFKFSNGELRTRSGQLVGRINGNEIRDKASRLLARIQKDEIRDSASRLIARVSGNDVRNPNSTMLAKIPDLKKEIDGSDYLDPLIIAALWICFIKRGL